MYVIENAAVSLWGMCNVWFIVDLCIYIFPFRQIISLSDVDGQRRRIVRKIYAVKVEFDQSGSLGLSLISSSFFNVYSITLLIDLAFM